MGGYTVDVPEEQLHLYIDVNKLKKLPSISLKKIYLHKGHPSGELRVEMSIIIG